MDHIKAMGLPAPQKDLFGHEPNPSYARTFPDEGRRYGTMIRLMQLLLRGEYVTLSEIRDIAPSADARLRDLRKQEFGGFNITTIADDRVRGRYLYKLHPPTDAQWETFIARVTS